jgi:gliding motility-associated-like protein
MTTNYIKGGLILFILFFGKSHLYSQTTLQSDSLVLLDFYQNTAGGISWSPNWLDNGNPIIAWSHIGFTDDTSGIRAFGFTNFPTYHLNGSFPSNFVLPKLESIYFTYSTNNDSSHSLNGNLPDFTLSPNLKRVRLYHHELSGPVFNWSVLDSLTHIEIHRNNLTGPLPSMDNLKLLEEFNIAVNPIQDSIPSLDSLENLKVFNAAACSLTGTIPSLDGLRKLEEFDINLNGTLSGSIPNLDKLDSLKILNLNAAGLSGSIPNLDKLFKLEFLDIGINNISGTIPSLNNLQALTYFNIQQNNFNFAESLPDFSNNTELRTIKACCSDLIGSIPSMDGLIYLRTLHVSWNQFSGSIPSLLDNVNLQTLYLHGNELTGTIPEINHLTDLENLNLQANNLTGKIPKIDNLKYLEDIYIQNNKFTFEGLEEMVSHLDTLSSVENFTYSPQDSIATSQATSILSVSAGGTLSNNTYTWYKNDVLEATNIGDSTLTITQNGDYRCEVTNNIAVNLTLYSQVINASPSSTCIDDAGQISTTIDGVLVTGSNNLVNFNSTISITHTGGDASQDGDGTSAPGFDLALYQGLPTASGPTALDITSDISYTGSVAGTSITGDFTFSNLGSYQNTFNGNAPIQLWFAPITLDDHVNQDLTENAGSVNECVHVSVSEAVGLVFLNQIDTSNFTNPAVLSGNGCSASIRLQGGLPQWNASNYTISVQKSTAPFTAAVINTPVVGHNSLLEFTVSEVGDYDINVSDGNGANRVFMVNVPTCANSLSCRTSDSLTLVDFYTSTNGANWTPSAQWQLNNPINTFYGITLNANECVENIHIYNRNVSETLPISIGDLSELKELYLRNNSLKGSIPKEIGSLSLLTTLSLAENNLGGELPDELCNLSNLGLLELSSNDTLHGVIPSCIGAMTSLYDVYMESCDFSGSLPEGLGNLKGVGDLFLRYNNLSGTIPDSMGTMTNLQELLLNGNELEGAIPSSFTNLLKLEDFQIPSNNIDSIPDLSSLPLLGKFYIQNNKVTFDDILPNMSINDFIYSPQDTTGTPQTVTVNQGTTAKLQLDFDYGVISSTYDWYKNGILTHTTSTNFLTINNVQPSDGGIYFVEVTNSIATDLTLNVHPITLVVQPSNNCLSGTSSSSNISCFGMNDGSSTITPNGGTTPYTYNWAHNSTLTSATASNLSAGNYTVTVTDVNNCSTTFSENINQPTDININLNSADVSCFGGNDGSLTTTASGGTGNLSYAWNNSTATTSSLNNLSAGNYTVTVTDVNNCSTSFSENINQPTDININFNSVDVSCFGGNDGSLTTTASGGTGNLSYAWNNSSATTSSLNNLSAGNYTVTVTDANNCSATFSKNINQPTGININLNSAGVSCFGNGNGNISTIISGGNAPYDYLWNTNDTLSSINNLPSGNYSVTITDANGCTASQSVTLNQPNLLQITTINNDSVVCFGENTGAAQVISTGGTQPYNYLWSDSQTNSQASNLSKGWYYVTLTDANNCLTNDSIFIQEPLELTLIATGLTPTCNGTNNGSANAIASGGVAPYGFLWDNGENTNSANTLSTGIRQVIVTDIKGCTATDTALIDTIGFYYAYATNTTDVICFGDSNGTATASTTGGIPPFSYLWSNGETTQQATQLNAGTHYIAITDGNGCIANGSANILSPSPLGVHLDSFWNVACFGDNTGMLAISSTGGTNPVQYQWSDGNTSALKTNLNAGSHAVTITDINGCVTNNTLVITQPNPLFATTTTTVDSCQQGLGSIVLDTVYGGVFPYQYNWSDQLNHGRTALNLATNSYQITITDANDCSLVMNENVITACDSCQLYAPIIFSPVPVNNDFEYLCIGDGTAFVSFSVTGGQPSFDSFGNYNILLNGSSESPDSSYLSNGNPFTFEVRDGDNWSIDVSDELNCSNNTLSDEFLETPEDCIDFCELNPININIHGDTTILAGDAAALWAIGGNSIDWTPSNTLSCYDCYQPLATPSESTTYTATVSDAFQCTANDTVRVTVCQSLCIEIITIPNLLTMNNDGINDVLHIENLELFENTQIEIINRWGQRVFLDRHYNLSNNWGEYEDVSVGVYFYILTLKAPREELTGYFTVIKP